MYIGKAGATPQDTTKFSELRTEEFLQGAKDCMPVVLGFLPVAISYAIIGRQAGLSILQTCAMSLTVFAGAAQMMAVGMMTQGAGIAAITIATFLLNLRHFIMSTCVFEQMPPSPLGPRIFSAWFVTDEGFALYTTGRTPVKKTVWYFLGIGLMTYLAWNIGSLAGAVLTDFFPAILSASLGVALYGMFTALLVPGLRGNARLALLVVLTALCNLLLRQWMSSSWALIAATLLGALAGVFFVDLGEEVDSDANPAD